MAAIVSVETVQFLTVVKTSVGCANLVARALDERELPGVTAIAFGDLFLADVRAYRERLLAPTGFEPVFPIWGNDTTQLARRFINDGFVARLVCVDTTQLDGSFADRVFDDSLLADLPPTVASLRRTRRVSHVRLRRPRLRWPGGVHRRRDGTAGRALRLLRPDSGRSTRPQPRAGPLTDPGR